MEELKNPSRVLFDGNDPEELDTVYITGQPTRPDVVFLTKEDMDKYLPKIKKLYRKRSAWRKKAYIEFLLVNGVMVWGAPYAGGIKLFDLELADNLQDPLLELMNINEFHMHQFTTAGVERVSVTNNHLRVVKQVVPMVSLPSPPSNSVLIVPGPRPFWLQLCRSGFLITDGTQWCKEDIGEVDYEFYKVTRDGDKYFVWLPLMMLFNNIVGGLYVFEKGRLIGADYYPDEDNIVFRTSNYYIRDVGDGYEVPGDFATYYKDLLRFAKVETDEGMVYVPLMSLLYLHNFLDDIGWW